MHCKTRNICIYIHIHIDIYECICKSHIHFPQRIWNINSLADGQIVWTSWAVPISKPRTTCLKGKASWYQCLWSFCKWHFNVHTTCFHLTIRICNQRNTHRGARSHDHNVLRALRPGELMSFISTRRETPTVGLEPTTTRLRALRSADWARRADGRLHSIATPVHLVLALKMYGFSNVDVQMHSRTHELIPKRQKSRFRAQTSENTCSRLARNHVRIQWHSLYKFTQQESTHTHTHTLTHTHKHKTNSIGAMAERQRVWLQVRRLGIRISLASLF